ncbi:hypothetical protein ACJJTC_017951 [Scirpophaga incertulas]
MHAEFLVYNVHVLIHLQDDVNLLGQLDNFSAFPFENYLGQLKRLVKSPVNSLTQICRRLSEKDICIIIKLSALKIWPMSKISAKCLVLPCNNPENGFICFPLVHTLQ